MDFLRETGHLGFAVFIDINSLREICHYNIVAIKK